MASNAFIVVTLLGAVFMLGGIAMIISGSVGLYSSEYYFSGPSWALLWSGITMELIGSALFAVARRMRWHEYVRSTCAHQHQHATIVANVEYVVPPAGYNNPPPPGYSINGYSVQQLNAPQGAAFASSLPRYDYVAPPPSLNQAPPPYEPAK